MPWETSIAIDGIPDLIVVTAYGTSSALLLQGNGDGTFTSAAINTIVGDFPDIVVGDFNGDGKDDLAVSVNGSVSILFGNGDGTFAAAGSFSSSAAVVAAADFNGDGKLDLVTEIGNNVEGGSASVAILLGNGDGTFTATSSSVIAGSAVGLVVGDFNNDGIPDMAAANFLNGGVTVLLGEGDGTFTANPVTPATGDSPAGLAVGDYNGDGRPDIVAANSFGDTLTVLITEPTETASTSATAIAPMKIGNHLVDASYAGDSNYVGSVSGTTMLWGQPPSTTTVLAITSGGSPITIVASGTAVTLTATVTVGNNRLTIGQVDFCDASADDCADIHLAGNASLTSNGTASFKFIPGPGAHSYKAVLVENAFGAVSSSPASTLSVSAPPHVTIPTSTTVAATGNIGDYSLTATVVGTGSTSSLTGVVSFLDTSYSNSVLATAALGVSTPGLAWLDASSTPFGDVGFLMTALGDFNGDGVPDIAAVNSNTMTVTVLLGIGDGTFKTAASPTLNGYTTAIVAGDFNGDGILDLAVSWITSASNPTEPCSLTILLGNGDGTFTAAPTAPAVGNYAKVFAAADFNGDGKLDLLINDYYTGTVILLGNGDATFSPLQATGLPATIAVADLNGDGIPDLGVGGNTSDEDGNAVVHLGVGDGTFQSAGSVLSVSWPGSAVVADFNGDGIPDIAVSGAFYSPVSVFLGKGDGTFTPVSGASNPSINEPGAIAIADFNHDGKADLAITNWNSYPSNLQNPDITILLGNGDGTFTPIPGDTQLPNTWSIIAADFNGDGTPDLAIGTSSGLSVLLTEPSQTATATATGVAPTGPAPHLVDASYPGDSNYGSSTSATTALSVQVATPTMSPGSTTYTSGQTITISDATPTATIYYEAFGSLPTSGFVQYTGPITLSAGEYETIEAYATATGYEQSAYATSTYTPSTYITAISPNYGAPAALIVITGANFGATQGDGGVTVGGAPSRVVSWSNTAIAIQVPSRATTGDVVVTAGDEASNGVAFTFYPYPAITEISPASGTAGTPVTIIGTGLMDGEGNGTVTFNGTPATILSQSGASIQVSVPYRATTGPISVRANGDTVKSSSSFTVVPSPTISGINPNYGAPAALIEIAGTDFGATQSNGSVIVGGAPSRVVSWSNTAIAIQVPSRATTGDIVVTAVGEASNGAPFTFYPYPAITGISPASGLVGTQVTIAGADLLDGEGHAAVTFNGTPATILSEALDSVQVVVPAGAVTGPISVRVNGDTVKSSSSFTVIAPQISSISQNYGAPAALIDITGNNFGTTQGNGIVTVGGALSYVVSWSSTKIAILVPSRAKTGNILVTTAGEASNGEAFTFYPYPVITSVSPASGVAGTVVTITGTSLLDGGGDGIVAFNGIPATILSQSGTSIQVKVPAGATTGPITVRVNGVTLKTSTNFTTD